MAEKPTPNDQRANVKNDNNAAHKADQANRANQARQNQGKGGGKK